MMKSVVLPQYNRNVLRAILSLKVEEREIPTIKEGEVLVHVYAAPANPSDIAFIQGSYNVVKTVPAVPGFEGSGIVEQTSVELEYLKGQKVSFFVQDDRPGTWNEYLIVKQDNLILLQDDMDMDQAACFAINPFTAFGLFRIAKQKECQAIIVNAAGGQVPAFIRNLAEEHHVRVINVVRKAETVNLLQAEGATYVLDEMEDGFADRLTELAHQSNATVAFDAVGGPQSGLLFNAMPKDSELVVYGGLSNKPMSEINVMDMIFKDKIISGFNLSPWMDELDPEEFTSISKLLQQKFIQGTWKTHIQETVPLDRIVSGLKNYLGNMSGGKILLKP